MKLFSCPHCGQVLYFENTRCEQCGCRLGYRVLANEMVAVAPDAPDRFCANAEFDACNWLIEGDADEIFCTACRFNRTIPDLAVPENLAGWRKIELAKHRLVYSLVRLGLTPETRVANPVQGLAFDVLAEVGPAAPHVLTGHESGLITLALIEADDAEREHRRQQMGEPYRTLLGHFRHEIGHYFWDLLVRDGGALEDCRALFGDDSQDYNIALQRYYADGAPADWQDHFVSAYATSHPWEDFAETWAHYLHIVDTLEMARAFGLRIKPLVDQSAELAGEVDFNPHHSRPFDQLIDAWLPLTFAANSLNRCMGAPDLYPFILSPPVVEKLTFIHQLVHGQSSK